VNCSDRKFYIKDCVRGDYVYKKRGPFRRQVKYRITLHYRDLGGGSVDDISDPTGFAAL